MILIINRLLYILITSITHKGQWMFNDIKNKIVKPGGGGRSFDPGMYQIIYGTLNAVTGTYRAKWTKTTDIPATLADPGNLAAWTSPAEGTAVAQHLTTGALILINNFQGHTQCYYDIPVGALVFAGAQFSLPMTGFPLKKVSTYNVIWAV